VLSNFNALLQISRIFERHSLNDWLIFLLAGKAGVVVDEGPNFRVEVQDVPVPEISMCDTLV
jgi:hypothetical protein